MASSAINGFTTVATDAPDNSRFGFDYWNGSVFATVQISKQNLQAALSKHFLNSNLTSTGSRSHDFDENDMLWGKVKTFRAEASTSPTSSYANFNFRTYGSGSSDVGFRITSQLSTTMETYGDNTTRFFKEIGVNGNSPASGFGTNSFGSIAGGRFEGAVYGSVHIGVTAGVYTVSSASYGVQASTTTGTAIQANVDGNGVAINSNGRSYVEEYGLGAGMSASAVHQINSTTRGALPVPRMTETQRLAISSPAIGLEVYQTDSTEGKYIYKSTGWTFII